MKQFIQNWNIIYYRSLAELKAEASNNYAGYIWWVLQPFLALAVYYVAFRWLVPYPDDRFTLFLFIGITVWQLWANTLIRSCAALITYRPLMLQLNIEKYVFPVSICIVNLVKFLTAFTLLLLLAPFLGGAVSAALMTLPLLLLLLLLLTCGTGMILAAVTPFCPDMVLVVEFLLHLMMFLSGVFFDLTLLPEEIQKVLAFNPLAVIISQLRRVMMDGCFPDWQSLAGPVLWTCILLTVGGWMLKHFGKQYPRMT